MTRPTGIRRGAWLAGAALLACVAVAPGCGRPTDEAWLQFLGFKQGGSTIGVFQDALRGESTATVDVEFENGSLAVGMKTGTGVFLKRARIEYRMNGFFPPSAEVPLNLYLEAPAESTPTTGTLSAFPLAPTSLKDWLIDTGAFEDATAVPVVELTAQVTFYAEASDGTKLETKGNIKIELTNSATTSPGTLPTLTVAWKSDVNHLDTTASGAFTVYRSTLGSDITVFFDMDGDLVAGTHYDMTSPIVMAGTSTSMEVRVTPKTGAFAGRVIITLRGSTEYDLGMPKTAQLNFL